MTIGHSSLLSSTKNSAVMTPMNRTKLPQSPTNTIRANTTPRPGFPRCNRDALVLVDEADPFEHRIGCKKHACDCQLHGKGRRAGGQECSSDLRRGSEAGFLPANLGYSSDSPACLRERPVRR